MVLLHMLESVAAHNRRSGSLLLSLLLITAVLGLWRLETGSANSVIDKGSFVVVHGSVQASRVD